MRVMRQLALAGFFQRLYEFVQRAGHEETVLDKQTGRVRQSAKGA
jgi:hypothetical protein